MKCSKCGEIIYTITKEGLNVLDDLGYDVQDMHERQLLNKDIKCGCGNIMKPTSDN